MYEAVFRVGAFGELPDVALCAMIGHLVEALASVDEAYLMNHRVPLLYESGVRYSKPPLGSTPQPWRDVPIVWASKHGTCHELAAWRLAELRFKEGRAATPYVTSQWHGGDLMFHVQILLPSGDIEDPSIALGMGANPWEHFR